MTYIVHPDFLRSGEITAILHLSADPAPIIREDTVSRLYIVELCQIVFQTAFQYLRHDHLTVISFCLRRIDIVFSVQTPVVLVDRDNDAISTCQSKNYGYAVSNPFFEIWLLLHHDVASEVDRSFAVTDENEYQKTDHFRSRLRDLVVALEDKNI